jgi:hypothetical protein
MRPFIQELHQILTVLGNEWFSRTLGKEMYCTDDASVSTLGDGTKEGEMSPKNLLTTPLLMSCVWELTLKEKSLV